MGIRSARLAAGLLLLAATALAYRPAWHGELLWDDEANVTAPELRSADGLRRIWTEPGATQQWFPLLHTAFWVEHRLWGDATLGYHVVNIVLHAASALLLARILRELGLPGAWLAAGVFALHPVHVQSVAWITEQKNTLSGVLFLLAVLAWLRFDATRAPRAWAAALGLYVAALMCKTSVVPLFGVLAVLAWWRRGRLTWRGDLLPLLPFVVLGCCAGLTTTWVERTWVGATGAEYEMHPAQRVLLAGRATWFYLGSLLWPAGLAFIGPRWALDASDPAAWAWPAALAALLAGAWALRRRTRGPLAGLLVFVGLLLPVLGVTRHYFYRFSHVAEHWQYLPSLGIIVLLAAGAARLAARMPARARGGASAAGAALLLALGMQTHRLARDYADPATHYRAILARNPACWMAHNNLGILLAEQGRVEQACAHYEEALRLRPGYGEAHHNLGAALARLGRLPEALQHYEASLRAKPDAIESLHNMGNVLVKLGRVPEAVARYELALRLEPDYAAARNNLGKALLLLDRVPEALLQLEEAARRRPADPRSHASLAEALLRARRVAEAVERLELALQLAPGDPELCRELDEARAQLAPGT